ncbi:MAG: hypothetical protein ABI472_10100 [Ginsengibacter sp.]
MLRYFLTIFYCVSFLYPSYCQDARRYSRDSGDLRNIPDMQIVLDTSDRFAGNNGFIFKSIRIEDVRFDTTNIGMYAIAKNALFPAIKNYKINFKNGAANSLHAYLNNFFTKNLSNEDEDKKLVCFLKRLNVTRRDTIVDNVKLTSTFSQINFEMEVFLKSADNYYAAFKIDTLLIESIGTRKSEITDEIKNYLLMPVLRIVQERINNTVWNTIMNKKSFLESVVINNYFNNRFNLPILTQPYKKGIYTSFTEFKNNTPSITGFTVKKGKSGTISLINANGDYLVTTKMFAFSDGEKCWILKGNFCYPLMRTGNSFEFFLTIIYNLKILLAINMETGEIS